MITGTGPPKELDRLSPTAMTLVIRFAQIYIHSTCLTARWCHEPMPTFRCTALTCGAFGRVPQDFTTAPWKIAVIRPRAIVREAIAARASPRLAPLRRGTLDFSA